MAFLKMNFDLTFLGTAHQGHITCKQCGGSKPSLAQQKLKNVQPIYRADVQANGITCDCCGLPLATA